MRQRKELTLEDLFADDLAVLVQLVDDGNTGSEFQVDNLFSRHAFEFHDHGSKGVSVRRDEDLFSFEDAGEDLLLVVGEYSLSGELEGLSSGRGNVVRTSPDVNLLFSKLLASVILVETGQLSVISFVEGLILDNLKGSLIDFFENDIEGIVGSGEDGSVGDVKVRESLGFESLSAEKGFRSTVFGEIRVLPSGKQVLSRLSQSE